MRRKVIQIADSTQLISLPRKWALKQGIKKGDELDIEEKGGKLVIGIEQTNAIQKVSMDVSNIGDYLVRLVGALYKSGYDELEFRFRDASILKGQVSKIVDWHPGFEILEQTNNKLIIKDIGQQQGASFDVVLRRLFIVTMSLANGFYEGVENGDLDSLKELISLEKSNNRFSNFCERLLSKYGHKEYKVPFIYVIVWELEKIADEYKSLITKLESPKDLKLTKETISLLRDNAALLKDFYQMFYHFEMSKIALMQNKKENIKERARDILKTKSGADALVAHKMAIVAEQIFNLLGSYLPTVHYTKLTIS